MAKNAKNFVAESYKDAQKMFSFLENPAYFPIIAVTLLVYIFFGPRLLPGYVIAFLDSGLMRLVMLVIVAVLLPASPSLAGLFLVAFLVTVLAARTSVFDHFEDMMSLDEEKKKAKEAMAKVLEKMPEAERKEALAKFDKEVDAITTEEEMKKAHEMVNAAKAAMEDEKKMSKDMGEMIGEMKKMGEAEKELTEEESKKESKKEGFSNMPVQFQAGVVVPSDFNYTSNCQNDCGASGLPSTSGSVDGPCNAVAAFTPELNAQGMNCPMGYSGPVAGANF